MNRQSLPKLRELNEEQYLSFKTSGMFWVYYPEATGIFEKDVDLAVCVRTKKYNIEDYYNYDTKHFYDIIDEDATYDF